MNIVLITAKGGNLSIPNKNLIKINGHPCLYYPITSALNSKADKVFISTECPMIKEFSREMGIEIIDRPKELSQPDSNHGEAILHGAKEIQKRVGEYDTLTILLGNTVMCSSDDINESIDIIGDNDSSMTVWQAQDDHPYRAMKIEKGVLKSFLDIKPDTNRQSYPNVYFYNQGPWTVRRKSLLRSERTREGPGAWWWMGERCVPIVQDWVTGRDIHGEIDINISKWYLHGH